MKHLLSATLAAVVLTTVSASALVTLDEQAEAAQKVQQRVEATIERLDLTDEQRPEIEAILTESTEKRLAILGSYGVQPGSRPDLNRRKMMTMRKEVSAVSDDTMAKLKGVLTEDQLAEYKKVQQEQRDAMRAAMQGR